MTTDEERQLAAHVAAAFGQLAERTGRTRREVAEALLARGALELERAIGTENAYAALCSLAASLARTADSEAKAVRH